MSVIQNRAAFSKHLQSFLPEKKKEMTDRIERIAFFIHERALARTPVHTGEAVANYQWSLDTPFVGTIEPINSPASPGRTNDLPLGAEPRRRANEGMANASFHEIDWSKTFGRVVYLSNNSEQWAGLEAGQLPESPLRQRSPMGMIGVALSELEARMQAGAI